MKLTGCSRCQCLLKNEEDADDYDPGLLDYPCTRVVTVVNAGAIKKRSRAPGEDAGEPTPPSPPASSRARGKAKCREFEGREEERCNLLLQGTWIFWRWEKLGGGRGFELGGIFLGLRRRNWGKTEKG